MVHVGVVPATDFLKDSGLPMTGRGEVVVDEVRITKDTNDHLRISPPNCLLKQCMYILLCIVNILLYTMRQCLVVKLKSLIVQDIQH